MARAPTFLDPLRITVATMQATHPEKADAIGRAHAAIVEGPVVDLGDGNGPVRSRHGNPWYPVKGVCECQAAACGKPCRHLQAWKLSQHVAQKVQAQTLPAVVEPTPTPGSGIDPRCITKVHGNDFVLYDGLLALAHERGLQSLVARFISVTDTLALAEATATFAGGRTSTEAADSTPENVQFGVRPHFTRLALTRAQARAFRDALNIGMVAVEELE
jgi:hypothetical protein